MVEVLVVDDDADLRHLLQTMLKEAGYLVRTAPDGQAALAQLRQSAHAVVVLLD